MSDHTLTSTTHIKPNTATEAGLNGSTSMSSKPIKVAEGVPEYRPAAKQGGGLIVVQPLQKQEMQPSYAQDLGTKNLDQGFYGVFINALGNCIGTCGAIPCCPLPNPYKRVEQGSVGLISRFGQFYKSVDPGLQTVNVCSESIKTVDVKIQMSTVPRQNVMTKDNVSVEIDSVICWHIVSPYRAAFGINDVKGALVERAQTTLRQVVGSRVLQTVVTEREGLAAEIQEIIEATATKWGVTVESILLKDITFSIDLQQSLSAAATQKRIGESRVIAARAEVDAAKLMRQAADILASPAAMQIRQLDTLRDMARTSGSKVVFVPMNLTTHTGGGGGGGGGGSSSFTDRQIAASMSQNGNDEMGDSGFEFTGNGPASGVGQGGGGGGGGGGGQSMGLGDEMRNITMISNMANI